MDMILGMNQEEVDILRKWNSKTATYVHGIGLNLGIFQKVERSRNEVRTEFGVNDRDFLIVSVGELDDNKNHATVIKALSLLSNRNYKYVICGVGPNKEVLTQLAFTLGLSNNVILAGYRSDIPDILHAAELFVFPSFHEGLPVSALEAMASGLPLLCSKIRGNVDIIKDGENGYLFGPDDYSLLASLINKLMDNRDLAHLFGEKNKHIVRDFAKETVIEELKKLYTI